jgi:hypothetical protein
VVVRGAVVWAAGILSIVVARDNPVSELMVNNAKY